MSNDILDWLLLRETQRLMCSSRLAIYPHPEDLRIDEMIGEGCPQNQETSRRVYMFRRPVTPFAE